MESKDILTKLESKLNASLESKVLSRPRAIRHPNRNNSTIPKGRPKGAKNTYKSRWEPKKWKVDHEMIVLMHINGKTNKEIAEIVNRSPIWISWVINCEHAKKMIQRVKDNLPTEVQSERYDRILDHATTRLENYLSDDSIAKSTPGAMVDRSMRAMEMIDKRLSRLSTTSTNTTNNTLVLATEANIDKIANALRKSEEVSKLHRIANG